MKSYQNVLTHRRIVELDEESEAGNLALSELLAFGEEEIEVITTKGLEIWKRDEGSGTYHKVSNADYLSDIKKAEDLSPLTFHSHFEPDEKGGHVVWVADEEGTISKEGQDMDKVEEAVVSFPFTTADMVGFVTKRKDGTMFKYRFTKEGVVKGSTTNNYKPSPRTRMSDYCTHNPAFLPTFESGGVRLFIADAVGVKNHGSEFDLIIDCGGVIPLKESYNPVDYLVGDAELVEALEDYVTMPYQIGPDLLKIDWDDRMAPPLNPEFWVKLAEELGKRAKAAESGVYDVVINCVGGHGRSGSAMVCLMMVMNPEYGSGDAITHLRAIHCSRAIESKVQHDYLDEVAKFLGQKANATEAIFITNYKEAFKKLALPSAKPYQERLK